MEKCIKFTFERKFPNFLIGVKPLSLPLVYSPPNKKLLLDFKIEYFDLG